MTKNPFLRALVLASALGFGLSDAPLAQFPLSVFDDDSSFVQELDDGTILAIDVTGTYHFRTWSHYVQSDFFVKNGKRCGALELPSFVQQATADCSSSFTNPAAQYDPSVAHYSIPVVVHVIQSPNGTGFVSDASVHSQIDILNEDFQAIAGSLGASGTDVEIDFFLATTDPSGNPTNGITRHTNKKWYNDQGTYYNSIGWDTSRYLNIYTNSAGGNLGYAYIPSGGGVAGQPWDGVRILWSSFGANAPIGPPYNLGRTTTHEVGHYLGLYHTFQGGCASASSCASNGDLICDTNPEVSPNYYPCTRSSCGSSDPTNNYLDYSDDICMSEFTPHQARRMRCTLESFRTDLISTGPGNTAPSVTISAPSNGTTVDEGTSINFSGSATDAEDGSLSSAISWSSNLDGPLGSGSSLTGVLSVGSHTVTASVTDSGGSSGSDSVSVTVNPLGGGGITLSASGFKVKGKHNADLTWSGAAGSNVDIYRNGALIATTANDGDYTDAIGAKGSATYQYQVCEAGSSTCSGLVAVIF